MENLEAKAKWVRRQTLDMIYHAGKGHIGGSLSCVDILVALFYSVMKEGDKFILSKGHACVPLYAILADKGYFPIEELATFGKQESRLEGHPNKDIPGVLFTTGSLGHGLGIGAGLAMTTKNRVFVLMGDGECQEGSVWEAARFAGEEGLNNLIAIIDWNGFQATSELPVDCCHFTAWESFGWGTQFILGYEHSDFHSLNDSQPSLYIAHTIKGKGISFMENKVEWHHKIPNKEEYEQACKELG